MSIDDSKPQKKFQRMTVVLNIEELGQARAVLGTKTTRETVNRALHDVNRQAALDRAAALVRQGGLNIVQPEDLPELRRQRHERSVDGGALPCRLFHMGRG